MEPSDAERTGPKRRPEPALAADALAARLQEALHRRDPSSCAFLAELIREERSPGAIEALKELLRPPQGWGVRLARWGRKSAWRQARINAALALAEIGSVEAIPALTAALLDPDERVREAAYFSLIRFGDAAAPELITLLTTSDDWTPAGMVSVIETLGGLESRQAVPVLTHVLSDRLPAAPTRWTHQTFAYPLRLVLVVGGYICLEHLPGGVGEDWPAYLMMLVRLALMGALPLSIFYIFLLMFVFVPLEGIRSGQERNLLANAAARALRAIRDKRALPEIVAAAFNGSLGRREEARGTLLALLPLLGPEDTGTLPVDTLRLLTDAMTSSDSNLTVALLHAMEFVGTGRAAKPVEQLSRRGLTPEIRAEALRVLPILEARARQEENEAVLLRASAQPATAPNQLLRPALSDAVTPQEQLLRPTQTE